ncbi:DUF3068 domain-containing protein [Actinoplanes regularis]|uniref:DUF3068 domain-containing protein n=1 Tax=Actinoplanes regularis TaxID=52697 RepID=A0A238Z475_9ACTN|nr:DUF3068 domain-containing protein [Actinoplanes regularis]GIE85817.1 hypothetical protein Are01nite_22970 [Actinoplanes regularis]SNR78225.1 Protein of unknown function [Actinoplanes regularis]
MRRFAGALLFGLGVLSVVAAAALAWLVVPALKRVPFDMKPPDVVVNAPDATFVSARVLSDGTPKVAVERGTLRNTTGIKPGYKDAAALDGKLAGNTLIWNVYQATDWVDQQVPISRAESRIALDRVSGAAVAWKGQCYNDVKVDKQDTTICQPGSITFTGQLYLFPFGTEKKTYQYFDGTLRRSLPMAYRGTEKVAGLRTYRFEQIVPRQDLAADDETVAGLLGFLAPKAKTATMSYQASRTLWVEPMTGAIVAYREQQHRELTPDTGAAIPILDATFQYDKATADTIVDQARDGRSQLLLYGRYLPIGLLLAGILAAVAGLMVLRRAPRPVAPAPEPEPSAVPQG